MKIIFLYFKATGIQLVLKEYPLDNGKIFTDEDVINIFPVVKHINPRATDAYNFYTTGQSKIQQGYLKDGYELISESLNLLNNVYGAMHPEIAQCLRDELTIRQKQKREKFLEFIFIFYLLS